MKKLIVILAIISLVVCSMFTVSAATEDDLIAKLKEIPAANNEQFLNGAIKLIKEEKFTEEEINKLIPLLEEAKTVLPEDKGTAARDYTDAQVDKVFELLDEACEITGCSYETTIDKNNDYGIVLYGSDNEVKLEYTDGKVNATGVESANNASVIYLVAGVLVLAAAGAVIVMRKRENA
ncbi:MAG: hypothetical protein IKB86_04045 [Clostridia bacterium]|nr:hypothetical protein [Clostridia bacterium]